MLVDGVAAAIGNVVGGRVTDRSGPDHSVMFVLIGFALVLLAIWFPARSLLSMIGLVAALGALTYAAVPAMQARVIGIAERHAPRALGAAAGLNIAGFNSGMTMGSLIGGAVIGSAGLMTTALAGAAASTGGIALLMVSKRMEAR